MRAVMFYGPGDVRVETVPDPEILAPRDAIVRVVACCVCGSDLWGYRGLRGAPVPGGRPTGHELIGVVEQLGSSVPGLELGDFVIAPFSFADGVCQACRHGAYSACERAWFYGQPDPEGLPTSGAQGEFARIAYADTNLVKVRGPVDEAVIPSLLALSDVAATGYHAAVSARVRPGDTVAVVGDGAVGLCAIIAAKLLGAERIVAMSRHRDRTALAVRFGATDVIEQRGPEAVHAVRTLLGGELVDAALECVGTKESMSQALAVVRGGGRVGFVGVPAGGPELPVQQLFDSNVTVGGGLAPVLAYLDVLLPAVLDGRIEPGLVFDLELPLERAADGYAAMDARRAIKTLLRP